MGGRRASPCEGSFADVDSFADADRLADADSFAVVLSCVQLQVWWGVIEEGQAPKQIIEGGEFFVLKKIAESGGHH